MFTLQQGSQPLDVSRINEETKVQLNVLEYMFKAWDDLQNFLNKYSLWVKKNYVLMLTFQSVA